MLPARDTEQLEAFEYLKGRLASTPILALPRREVLFILDTDACAVEVSCTLLQKQPDKSILPLGYYSRGLILAEKKITRKLTANAWPWYGPASFVVPTWRGKNS